MATPPNYTLDQIIQQLTTSHGTDGWGNVDTDTHTWHAAGHDLTVNGSWGFPTARLGYGDQLTYSLGVAPAYSYPLTPTTNANIDETSGLANMSAVQIAGAQLAFQLWDDLVSFSIVQNSSPGADITLNYSWTTAWQNTAKTIHSTYTSNDLWDSIGGDKGIGYENIWLAESWPELGNAGFEPNGFGMMTMEHEIGHALGLSHPGTYRADLGKAVTFDNDAVYATDNRQYTIMSYFGYYSNNAPDTLDGWTQDGNGIATDGSGGTAGGTMLNPQTPMVDDIAAIQSLYGADYSTRAEGADKDTVYGFNCNITPTVKSDGTSINESWIYDFNKNLTPIFSIWDGGGNDTLDCSGYNGLQIIDLTPGSYSSVDGLSNNIGIAYGCDIENAVGGGGDDTFIVSYAYGDFHTLNGGAGTDTVVFSSFTKDILVDLSGNYSAVLEADGWHDLANLVSIENVVGGAGNDEISGNDEANRIRAGSGNDTIHGGGGKDTLLAGLGVDTIYGDDGDDTLVETYKYNPFAFDYLDGGTGTNTLDFGNYQDALRIDLSAGTASTTDSADLASGTLRKVATLVSIQNVYGGAGNDEITGDDEDNRIFAGAGNDTIHGGGGKDTLLAGLGVDTIYGDDGDDTLVETYKYNPFAFDYLDGGTGANTVDFSKYQDAVRIDLSAGTASTTDSADLASGTLRQVAALVSIENAIGGAGNDVLTGDSNNNTIDGGAGINTAVFHGPRSDYTITSLADGDLQVANSVAGRDGTDLLKNIQNLQFSDGDILYGTPGADTLQGTSGDDTLIGEAGDDILTGGLGKDTFVFGDNWGVDTITDFEVGSDVLDMIAVSGLTSFSQLMMENIYFPNGATGVVIMFGDNRIIIPNIDSSQVTPAMFKFAAPVTVLAESADLNVAYADASTATSGLYYALAGTGVQMVFGSAGNDVLDASGTTDYHTMLYGGAGNDTLIAGSGGSYTLQGGPGDDTAVFSGNQSDYTIDGSPAGWPSWATVTNNATGAVNWLQSVEHLQFADGTIDTPGLPPGGDFTNVLFLDSSNPPANIGPGYDTVYVDDSHGPNPVHLNLAGTNVSFAYGGLGNDVFDASGVTSGVDMWGQWGNDVLIGGAGNDTLMGDEWLPGGGNDWLDGGAGNDWLEGGNGDDTFVFRAGSGMDTVEDFDQTYPISQPMPWSTPTTMTLSASRAGCLRISMRSSPPAT